MADDVAAGQIEARLAAAASALREREIVLRRCRDLEGRVGELDRHLVSLRAESVSEATDVRRLEGLTLTRVLASLRGDRDDRLVRERAESYAATLRVRDAEVRLVALRRELEAVQARLHGLAGAPAVYAAVLDDKERYLRAAGDSRVPRMLELADDRGRLEGELHELGEALAAAAAAHQALVVVEERLRSASRWSTYDTFFGGGLISSSIKHDRLDDAAAAAAAADRHLAVLRTELADVEQVGAAAPQMAFSGLTRFLDVWFDNLFTDWAVAGRIRRAQGNVDHCRRLVELVQSRLHESTSMAQAQLGTIEAERRGLLTRKPT